MMSLRTAGTEWKLRHRRAEVAVQQRTFGALLPSLAAVAHWRAAGVEPRMSYADFQSRVPLQTPELLAPAIARMMRGEADVLWPGRCALFVRTSGTTSGEPKHVPVTEPMLAHFRRMHRDALLYFCVRRKHAGVFRGRHLLLGGSTELHALGDATPVAMFEGEFAAVQRLAQPAWAEKHLLEPPPAVARIAEWNERLPALVTQAAARDLTLLGGTPGAVLSLVREMREQAGTKAGGRPLTAWWPNLECLLHGGMPIAPYYDELRAALGNSVVFHEVYRAAEGFIATQDGEPIAGLRLMADGGLFFEFLPLADFHEGRIAELGGRAVPLAGVAADTDYVLVLTTPAGLVRTVIGDVVRFTSVRPPRLVYVGCTAQRLNAFGESILEKEVTDALAGLCRRRNWSLTNFHIAPLRGNTLKGQRDRHEWWIELKPGTVATPTGPQISAELDAELARVNADYAARREAGTLGPPLVRLVMPGVFEHWLRYQQRWGGDYRLPRSRNDRVIADDLARITNFAPE